MPLLGHCRLGSLDAPTRDLPEDVKKLITEKVEKRIPSIKSVDFGKEEEKKAEESTKTE